MPLSDVTVLDLSRVLSGPFATQQLADLGAQIIKVEHPEHGDDTRGFGPPFVGGESTYFMSVNRAKRSVAIDLKSPRGRELVRRLALSADIVIENFRPGTAERLGLGLESLRRENRRLITCSISGYGTGGDADYDGRPGYDAIVQGASGLMALTGAPDGPPTKVGIAISDMVAGLYAAQGILAALVERRRTGRGRHVEISMQDAMCALLTYQAAIWFATERDPPRMGDAHPSICPYETVRTKDGRMVLAVGNDAQFRRLAKLIGRPELAEDPRFITNPARVSNRPALLEILGPALESRTSAEWEALLPAEGIPSGPVLSVGEALEHPQMKARGSILEHDHPTAGRLRTIASPVRLDGARPAPMPPPPRLGEHTDAVLQEWLDLDEATLAALHAEGAIRRGPRS